MRDAPDQCSEPGTDAAPDHCLLSHLIFTRLADISFRRASTDGTPVMIVPFGEREASVPLRSLQREFGIDDDTPDGRMLGLIAESLDYVTGIHLGDPLPAEVVSGKASWEPAARHRQLAATRLRVQLLGWLDPQAARDAGRGGMQDMQLDGDPRLRAMVQSAFRAAAAALELPSAEAVVTLMEDLGEEFAYVEALRERLLGRVQKLAIRTERMGRLTVRADGARVETLTQVCRLTVIALGQFRARFDDIDAQTGEIIATLRNAESQTSFVRSNRDWLYRCLRAWEPVLREWDKLPVDGGEAVWGIIATTYPFLARRYMPTSEWPSFNSHRRRGTPKPPERIMAW